MASNCTGQHIVVSHSIGTGSETMHKLNDKTGTYPANEGIYIQSIRDAVAKMMD